MATAAGQFDLRRFLKAQDEGGVYERALAELRAGRKTSHWMWFVFPQLAGLGRSATSRAYAIGSLEEAQAYLRDPLLGGRLLECAQVLSELRARSAEQVFGTVDARKLHSSVTLFARAEPEQPMFEHLLRQYFDGSADPATDALLD
jgi:uncharacterized protein (DUF1810 family)